MMLFQVSLPHAAIDADLHARLLVQGKIWNMVIAGFYVGQSAIILVFHSQYLRFLAILSEVTGVLCPACTVILYG